MSSNSNPSHLLINRNPPRSPAHPQLVPTLSSLHPQQWSQSTDVLPNPQISYHSRHTSAPNLAIILNDDSESIQDEVVDVHPTFWKDAQLAGRVKVIVGRYEFWCHKEVLYFASPFFQSLLQGNWAENHPPPSTVLDISRSPSPIPSEPDTDTHTLPNITECELPPPSSPTNSATSQSDDEREDESRKASIYLDAAEDGPIPNVSDILRELREIPTPTTRPEDTIPALGDIVYTHSQIPKTTTPPLPLLLQPSMTQPLPPVTTHTPSSRYRGRRSGSGIRHSFSSGVGVASRNNGAEAVVELQEESAVAFQDFLFWAYPHLECKVTWTNVENLIALSSKLLVPALTKICDHFLMTHASGRPVMALSLAEQYANGELYREASRFVLDQPTWDPDEMESLSDATQLKLSKRRNWFLERLLKLGSIDVKKEYTCRADCPDPARCQAQLDEKWRQAHSAVCRYGPPQPSVAFRCLRQLETFPTNPSLVMAHPLCQTAAKAWCQSLFNRMFQITVVASPMNAGTEKYWLWISLN